MRLVWSHCGHTLGYVCMNNTAGYKCCRVVVLCYEICSAHIIVLDVLHVTSRGYVLNTDLFGIGIGIGILFYVGTPLA